jgi:signal transduction histidine kinase
MGHDSVDRPDDKELPAVFDTAALAFIRRNVQSLVRLLNELLDFTHVANDVSALELVKVNAHQVIRFALKNLESQQHGAGIGIELRLEAAQRDIRGDALKLEQVMANLIGNALKFTPRGGKVSIITRNDDSDTFVVEVSDTGMGITADALSRIFAPFEQGNSSIHSRYGGLGLGLAIAQTLTQAQGGTLEAASEGVDKGARFTARFKLDDSSSGKIKGDDPRSAKPEVAAPSRNGDGLHSGTAGDDGKEPTRPTA